MNAIRTNRLLRIAIVTMALFGWLVLSNHCALSAALARKPSPTANAESSCCKNPPKPAEGNSRCPQMPEGCCKSLKVSVPDAAKVPLPGIAVVVPFVAELCAFVISALGAEFVGASSDGPPPDSPTFAELVLHRSLRSHAPPVLA